MLLKTLCQHRPGVFTKWLLLGRSLHPPLITGRWKIRFGLLSTEVSRKGQMLLCSETPVQPPALSLPLCRRVFNVKPPTDRGSDRCYVPEILPESTANTGISVHIAGCLERMLKGDTKTVHRRPRRRCFLGCRAGPKQTEIKHWLFLVR